MSRGRRRLVRSLVVLGSIFAFLAVIAIWTERQALNTDDWVDTSNSLIADETIRQAVGDYLVDQLYENVDVEQELKSILPGDTKDLAGPVSGGLRQVAGDGADQVLKTSTAQELWRGANRTAHEELLSVLEDRRDEQGVSTDEGEVTLDLATLVTNLANEVGIGEELAKKLPEDAGQIVILQSDQLQTAQAIAVAIKGLAIVFSLLTFLTFGLAIYLSRERWVTVLLAGVGLIAAGFAVIVVRQIVGGIVVDQLVQEENIRPAAEEAWSISTSLMVSISTTTIVIGVLFAIAGWLASPTASARSVRRVSAPVLRDFPGYVYATLVVVLSVYLVAAPTHNLRSFLTTLLVAGLAAFGIHELRKQSGEEFPDASLDDTFGRTRERVSEAVRSANLGERAQKLRLPEVRMPGGGPEAGPGDSGPAGEAGAGSGTGGDELDNRLERLERIGALKEKGVLTEDEFQAEKARIMGGGEPPVSGRPRA